MSTALPVSQIRFGLRQSTTHSRQNRMLGRAACAYIFFKRFFSNGNIQYAPHSFLVYIGTKLASTSRLSLQAKHQAALLVLVLACTQGMLRSGRQAVALRSRQKYGFTLTLQHLNSSQRLRYALYEEFISKTNWTKCAYTSYRMLPCHHGLPPSHLQAKNRFEQQPIGIAHVSIRSTTSLHAHAHASVHEHAQT